MQEKTSQNANLILQRLKSALKARTDIELSEFLNVKPNTISSWKKRNTLDYSGIIAICELYEINLNEIFYNKTSPKSYESIEDGTYLVSRDAQFQYCVDNKSIIETLPKFNFPFLRGEATRAFQAISNNMFPIVEENAYALCIETEIEKVQEGDLVVIISQKKGFFMNRIKKVTDDDSQFELTFEVLSCQNIFFNKADINEIWLIKGVLSYDMRSNSKLKFLNNNLKIMDAVLAKIS